MKKQIVDLLPEGAVRVDENNVYLKYVMEVGEARYHKEKKLEFPYTEIEEQWIDCRVPLGLTSELSKNVGISKMVMHPYEVEEAKKWVFNSILYGILVYEAKPKDAVYIWTEMVGECIKVCGLCEIW